MMKNNKNRMIIGALLSLGSLVLGLIFHYKFVIPAYTPLANGNFGEMYGPVSYFKTPFFILCGIILFAGIVLFLLELIRNK